MNIKTILLATDFSEDAQKALEVAVEWAQKFEAEIHVIHGYFVDVPAIYGGMGGDVLVPSDIMEPVKEAAENAVKELVADLESKGIGAHGQASLGDASGAILREAERVDADLIVIGTRGLTGLKHVLLGSTAERVVRLATCPVLTVKGEH